MKKSSIILILVLALAGLLMMTCPTRQDHKQAIFDVVDEYLNQRIAESDNLLKMALGTAFGSTITHAAIEQMLVVKQYGVCSLGVLRYQGEERTVSVGVLNKVYTFSQEDMARALQDGKPE